MVFNTSFNNISAISLRPVLLVEKIEVPGSKYLEKTTDLLQVTDYIVKLGQGTFFHKEEI
jgi:hypothetical protein